LNTSFLIDAAAYTGVNLVTFLAFGWDKHCTRLDRCRIPEATLFQPAFFGGPLGVEPLGTADGRINGSRRPADQL
jgi:uncharacterized membrane protein YsdA (DUF1294 family)